MFACLFAFWVAFWAAYGSWSSGTDQGARGPIAWLHVGGQCDQIQPIMICRIVLVPFCLFLAYLGAKVMLSSHIDFRSTYIL